jgi:hypothetical protein
MFLSCRSSHTHTHIHTYTHDVRASQVVHAIVGKGARVFPSITAVHIRESRCGTDGIQRAALAMPRHGFAIATAIPSEAFGQLVVQRALHAPLHRCPSKPTCALDPTAIQAYRSMSMRNSKTQQQPQCRWCRSTYEVRQQ